MTNLLTVYRRYGCRRAGWDYLTPIIKSILLLAALSVAGCGLLSKQDGPPRFRRLNPDDIRDAVPRVEPKSRYGNPPSYVVFGKRYHVRSRSVGYVKRGIASWYGRKFHGRRTSNGETYDMYAMTAAHRSLPLPTYVQVTNLDNRRRAIVRVNDRGPFHSQRIIDLSYAAAVKLGVARTGTAHVEVRAIDPRRWKKPWRAEHPVPAREEHPNLYVQVGAFTSRSSAERLQARLRATVNDPVRITATPGLEHALYRVRLGPFIDAEYANRLSEKLAGLGFGDLQLHTISEIVE
uniref:Endolytic peptidoglycan transglycosylase RlpA n=1 Tax=Candidatus Kentrum sp. DK TaxID=2126562 RepID=A0A450TED9_9GAMM|nr:MAG: rare lipoprotein A [Candidatus Kentron sp. DK]